MLNYYKFIDTNTEFLCYSDNNIEFPKSVPVELIEENADPSHYPDLPILQFETLMLRGVHQKARIPDKILEENNCLTFNQLSASYFLIKNKQLNKPRRIRDIIEKKYADVICYVNPSGDSDIFRGENSEE